MSARQRRVVLCDPSEPAERGDVSGFAEVPIGGEKVGYHHVTSAVAQRGRWALGVSVEEFSDSALGVTLLGGDVQLRQVNSGHIESGSLQPVAVASYAAGGVQKGRTRRVILLFPTV